MKVVKDKPPPRSLIWMTVGFQNAAWSAIFIKSDATAI